MQDDDKHNFALALWLGSLGAFIAMLILHDALVNGWRNPLSLPHKSGGWFYEYQTFFGALIAGGSVYLTWFQYYQNQKRKKLSARGRMPDALSAVCSYARDCFNFVLHKKAVLPSKNTEELVDLKNAIEFVDLSVSEALFELLSFYQVHNSRLRGYLDEVVHSEIHITTDNSHKRMYDSVKLYALASRLFDYARNENKFGDKVNGCSNKSLSIDEMHSALNEIYGMNKIKMPFDDKELEDLYEIIQRKHS